MGTADVQGLLVLFVAHPGLCKTELCDRLEAPGHLSPDFEVHQLNTKIRHRYWQRAAEVASRGNRTVVLAKKNLVDNSPGGNYIHVCMPKHRLYAVLLMSDVPVLVVCFVISSPQRCKWKLQLVQATGQR